jgi:hypothetical protein
MTEAELPPFAPEWLAVSFELTNAACRLLTFGQAEQMQGGRLTMMPGPVEDLRALFQNIFAGIKPFLPPPTDAVQTG